MNRLPTIIAVINLACLLAIGTWMVLKDQKIVYVDSLKLINSYKGMTTARSALQQKSLGWQANIDTLARELEARVADYKAAAPTMTSRERKLAEELVAGKQQQLTEYRDALEQRIRAEDEEMSRRVLHEINDYLKTFGADKGYDIILAATDYGNIAYAAAGLDVTDEVIEGLNKK